MIYFHLYFIDCKLLKFNITSFRVLCLTYFLYYYMIYFKTR